MKLVEVSKKVFFARIGPLNVHPRSERETTFWETPNRNLIGKSTPGYMCGAPKVWFLVEATA